MVSSRSQGGRSRFILLLLTLTSVTLITVDFRGSSGAIDWVRSRALDVFAPIERTAAAVFSPVGDFFTSVVNYSDLEAENDRLRAQLEEARSAPVRAADAERERDALLDLNGLEVTADIPSVAARVVSSDASNVAQVIEIDRGTAHGVAEGMPVVAGGGLVGRVVRTSEHRAVVLLVTDATFRVGIRFTRTGEVGVAAGSGRGKPLDADLVDATAELEVGEAVVTSGLQQGLYPPGIAVGLVRSDRLQSGALQRDVSIDPSVDLQRLAFVRVLQWTPTVS